MLPVDHREASPPPGSLRHAAAGALAASSSSGGPASSSYYTSMDPAAFPAEGEAAMAALLGNPSQEQLWAAGVVVHGPMSPGQILPNTLSVALLGLRSSCLLHAVHDIVAASAGAACHSSEPSVGSAEAASPATEVKKSHVL